MLTEKDFIELAKICGEIADYSQRMTTSARIAEFCQEQINFDEVKFYQAVNLYTSHSNL